MKIFGIGLHRTATRTVTKMLQLCGWNICHYEHWQETMNAYYSRDFRLAFLNQYDGAIDLPIPIMFAELDRAYNDSKFIFTDRKLDSWLQSCEQHCASIDLTKADVVTHEIVFGSRTFDRSLWTETYYWHRRSVREYFAQLSPDKLMTIHLENDLVGNDTEVLARVKNFVGKNDGIS